MWIKEEVNDIQLGERRWSGAVDTWRTIEEAGKTEQAMQYFEEIFCDQEAIDITTINDILWMEPDSLLEYLGLNEEENEEYYITDEEFEQLKDNGVLTELHIKLIEENFYIGCHRITTEELNDAEELSDEEIEELNRVVA